MTTPIDDPAAPYGKRDDDWDVDDENDCRKPCDPDVGCPRCADYWQRMSNEGLWDMDRHRWTDKGWKEIVK